MFDCVHGQSLQDCDPRVLQLLSKAGCRQYLNLIDDKLLMLEQHGQQ